MQVTSPVGNCCTLASQERRVSFGVAGVFNDEQNAALHWLKGDFRCSTGMPGMGAYLLWGPAPSAASSLLCDAPCSTAVGKVGHQNTKCTIAEIPGLVRPASGRGLDLVTSTSPLQTTFFCNSTVQWGCRVCCWRCLFPSSLGLFSCPFWAVDNCSNNWDLAAEQDVAVPHMWGDTSLVTWEIPLIFQAEPGASPTGGWGSPSTYTLYCTK